MTDALWTLAAYALQLAAIVTVALAAMSVLRIRVPRHSLHLWQAVLVIALLLPLAQPRAIQPSELQVFARSLPAAALAGSEVTIVPAGFDPGRIVLIVIALGIIARLLWLGVGLIRLRSIVARTSGGALLAPVAGDLMTTLGVAAELRVSDDIEGPATVGVRRPLILIPRSVLAMSTTVQRAIICHELVHVKRRDWLQTVGEEIWRSVMWFHPHAHVIASRLSLAREMVVDEATILLTRDRRAYAEALLAFSDPQPHVIGVTPFIGRRTLGRRISLIAAEGSISRHRALAGAAIVLTSMFAITAASVAGFPMFATLQAQSEVHRPGNGVSLPEVVKEVKPDYTPAAMDAHIQGSVWLSCVVDANGDIAEVTVTRSLDTEYGLDQAAVDAAKQWKFRPGRKDGKAVAVRITIELTFRLK